MSKVVIDQYTEKIEVKINTLQLLICSGFAIVIGMLGVVIGSI